MKDGIKESPTKNVPDENKSLDRFEIKQEHLLAARNYLARFQDNRELSQDGMATLLGCSNPNTYSKWERGNQTPISLVGRAVELLILNAMWSTGEFTKDNPPTLDDFRRFFELKISSSKLGFGTRMRTFNRDREMQQLYKGAYQFFSECHGTSFDGYKISLPSQTFILAPAFNVNGKIRNNHISMLEQVLQHLASRNNIKPAIEDNALTALTDHYAMNGYGDKGSVKTRFFTAARTDNNLRIRITNQKLFDHLGVFLAEASEHVETDERNVMEASESSLKDRLARLIRKVDGAEVMAAGDAQLISNVFLLRHGFGGNFRLKRHDINLIEKVLCILTKTNPDDIPLSATSLVRDMLIGAPQKYLDSKGSAVNLWVTDTHFMQVSVEGRSIRFRLKEPHYIELINDYIKGIVPGKDVKGEED